MTGTAETRSAGELERLARGSLLNLLGAGVYGASGFVVVVLVSRAYPVGTVGSFLVAVALFNVLSLTARAGVDVGLVRFVSAFPSLDRAADVRPALLIGLRAAGVVGGVLGLLLLALSGPLAGLFAQGDAAGLAVQFRVLAVFLPVSVLHAVAGAATRGFGTMGPTVLVEKVARPAVQVLAVALAALLSAGPGWLALAWAGPFLPALAATAWWLRRVLAPLPPGHGRPERALVREFWSFCAPRALAGFFQVGMLWADTLLLGLLASTEEAGVYAAVTRYLLIGQLAQLSVTDVVQPQVSRALAAGAQAEAARLYQVGTAWLVSLTWPIYLFLGVFAPVFAGLFGPAYARGAPALSLLCAAMIVATIAGPVDAVLLMGGRSSWSLANTASAFALNVGLNLVLIPRLGLVGAALAWAAGLVWRNIPALVQVDRLLHLNPFGRGVRLVAPVALLLWGGTALLARSSGAPLPLALAVSALLSCTGYAAVLWRCRELLDLPPLLRALRR